MCLLGNMASGGAAGATSLLVVYPLDFARTRLAMDTGVGKAREFTGTVDCILKTARASGWGKGGVYNGFVVSCVGIVAYRGAYFGLYDTVADIDAMRGAGFAAKFALGYSVTVTAGLLSYPLDTIRRRMMMTSGGQCNRAPHSFFVRGSAFIQQTDVLCRCVFSSSSVQARTLASTRTLLTAVVRSWRPRA
jgi:hypothetical protein